METKPNSKKCKFCTATFAKFKELSLHVKKDHVSEWKRFSAHMSDWDFAHEKELGAHCPICPHRGKHIHGGTSC